MTAPKTQKKGKAPALLSAEEVALIRLRQLTSVFAKADSTLAGHPVTVSVDTDPTGYNGMGQTPAMSQAGHITFNALRVPDVNTVEGLVNINGLNYHELAHILYTPNRGALVQRVQAAGNHQAFNVLEDQRIETILVAKYPSIAPYLVATVAEYFVNTDPKTHDQVWPYLYGRKYLPKKMRSYFHGAANADPQMQTTMMLVERIIDQYVRLDVHDPANETIAFNLIDKFATVVGRAQKFSPFGHQGATACAQGGVSTGKQVAQARGDQADANANPGAPGGDVEDGGADGDDGDDDGGSGDNEDGSEKGEPGGAGTGGGDGNDGKSTSNINDILQQVANAARQNPHVSNDIRLQREAMSMGKKFRGTLPVTNAKERDVASSSKIAAKQFGKQLGRLVADSDPGWHSHRSSGRVNVGRAMHGVDLDTVFDAWDSGKQDTDSLELVILVDTSDSMDQLIDQAFEAVWTIKYGAETLGKNVDVSVIRFSNDAEYIYAPGERAKPTKVRNVKQSGGTTPNAAIREALRIFMNSTRKHKMVLFVTDGAWSDMWNTTNTVDAFTCDQGIERMNGNGITTACVFLMDDQYKRYMNDPAYEKTYGNPDWYRAQYGHGCQVFRNVETPADLVPFAKSVVTATLRK